MKITYTDIPLAYNVNGLDFLLDNLDTVKGMYLASDTDYPGRYSRWDIGFDAPPVEILGFADHTEFHALTARGEKLVRILHDLFKAHPAEGFEVSSADGKILCCAIKPAHRVFSEEERSRQPSPLSPLRHIMRHTAHDENFAGFYGAFKYDLLFCFNPMPLKKARGKNHVLFCLYIPDRLYILDRRKETVSCREFEFSLGDVSTAGIRHEEKMQMTAAPHESGDPVITSNISDAEYAAFVACAKDAAAVARAKEHINKGDVFELVLSRKFAAPFEGRVSSLFRNIRRVNPSPYEFLVQMGSEQLVGASPEMFVRVQGRCVESCPIAGTARRSKTPGQAGVIEDAKFKTFGCGSAIASSSLITEWVKGKTIDQAVNIKNTEIAEYLALPPVKIHCSVLAEDAIKAAIADYKMKHGSSTKVDAA